MGEPIAKIMTFGVLEVISGVKVRYYYRKNFISKAGGSGLSHEEVSRI